MWNEGLSFSVVIVTCAIALISAAIAFGRREKALWIYAAGFSSMAASFAFFILQGKVTPWIGIILPNSLILIFHCCIAWGIRSFYGYPRQWPWRFWLYIFTYLASLLVFTFVHPSFAPRGIIVSAFIIVLTAEFLAVLVREISSMPGAIRYPVTFFLFPFIIFHAVRIALISLHIGDGDLFMSPGAVTTFTLSCTMFFSVLWAGSLMILDSTRLVHAMEKKNSMLADLALKDGLTGLFNRHFLDHTIQVEMQRHDRYGEPLSLIMIDLDHFKRVNDLYGHDAGDAVLIESAKRIGGAIRQSDFLFRWGGEEFLVLAPHTDRDGASALASKLRERLVASPVPPVDTVTASFGVAERVKGESRMEWFRRVDRAVYLAKSNGRNRVEVWTETMAVSPVTVKIEWRDEWNCGNEMIDREHREILALGNRLIELALDQSAAHMVEEQVDTLIDHVFLHFADEERILEELSYPGLSEHAQIHRELVREADSLNGKFSKGELDAAEFFRFLVETIVLNHMLSVDILFFPYTKGAVKQGPDA